MRVLDVDNAELLLRPGMTATAADRHAQGRRRAGRAQRRLPLQRRRASSKSAGFSLQNMFMPRLRPPGAGRQRNSDTDGVRTLCVLKDGKPVAGQGQGRLHRRRAHRDPLGRLAEGDVIVTGSRRGRQVMAAPGAGLIRFDKRLADLRQGRGQRPCAGGRRPDDRPRRVRRHHGPVRLGQVDGHEHHRLPRHADQRPLRLHGRRRRRRSTATSARCCAATIIGFVFQGFNLLAPHHGRRECRTAADLSRHASAPSAARWPCARCADVGPAGPREPYAGRTLGRPAAARRDRPRHRHPPHCCCSPTSRPAISTRARTHEIMDLLTRLNEDRGLTIVMVTHEADIAAFAHRTVGFRRRARRADRSRWRWPPDAAGRPSSSP